MNGDNIEKIIDRCTRGDAEAQSSLYSLYSLSIFNTSLRIVGSPQDAEEIMHDSFIKIFRSIKKYNSSPKHLYCSLRMITVNRSIDYMRKKRYIFVDAETIETSAEIDIESLTYEEYSHDQIVEAIDSLPQGYKIILTLKLIEKLSTKEISKRLAIKEASVRSHYARARERVVKLLKSR